ncbi:unnamed protein product [Phytomonas sp. Hart1]|nr:unnamed protein product [Phytomonas sp. Hart1]|eukprot:CCW68730.1 unnamed protein product [Phytomonas sp. isolate Hart1]
MHRCRIFFLQLTALAKAQVIQGSNSSDFGNIKGFYSSLSYDYEFKVVEVPSMTTQLLPFQKEGVGWMAHREINHVGGIMADHLGMGKTIQMIALCLVSDNVNRLVVTSKMKRLIIESEGYRLLTIVRQLQNISIIANCTKLNRPADDLNNISLKIENAISDKSKHCTFSKLRNEVDKWLDFTAKFHPSYQKRATSFLNDEENRDFESIQSKEFRTLVVVPASLMLQWQTEIESKVDPSRGIKVYLYHGDNKWITSTELETYDFVITTYDTLTYSAQNAFIPGEYSKTFGFNRKEAGPLFHIHWKRVILDEAHMIRHSKTFRWRAIRELCGVHRWVVTATPLHNTIQDLQNLLHFVGLSKLPLLPGSNTEDLLNDPILQRSIARSLQPAFLRRGPVMIRNGVREVLVQLPPKSEVVIKQPFTMRESQMYNSILARSRSALSASEYKEGSFHIFAMMTKLRQVCCHPWISQGKVLQVFVCGLCNTEATGAVITKCGHHFCYECLMIRFREVVDSDDIANRLPCPTCGAVVLYDSVFKRVTQSSSDRIARYRRSDFELSTKLDMILKAYRNMRSNFPDDKMIIFSHFTSFMDVIAVALERFEIEFMRIDGTMTLTNRNITIRGFQTNPNVKLILASKTATGVGLNLTAANHVLVVDPWWNPAIEEQAVHRCYRIGQKKPVYVSRFIISDTIEQYCYEICQKKKEFGDAILRAATSGDSGAKLAASKLQELVARLKFVDGQNSTTTDNITNEKINAPSEEKIPGEDYSEGALITKI